VTTQRSEFDQLVREGGEAIVRANVAASAVLSVVSALNAANAEFLRAPTARPQVEQRLAAKYHAQCQPLEDAATDLEREMATLAPAHRRICSTLRSDPAAAALASTYLTSIVRLSAASVLAIAELANLPEALDGFGLRVPSLGGATARLAPATRRVVAALGPAADWGSVASRIG
jgi:hypothetical protein